MWLEGPIPERVTLEAIEQILLDSKKFKRLEVDQVQLLIKRIILKPGKQSKGNKKVSTIHVVVLEDKRNQTRKALEAIYPSIPRQYYPEGIQWIAIENIVNRYSTVT